MENTKLKTSIQWLYIGAWIVVLIPLVVIVVELFTNRGIVALFAIWSSLENLLYYLAVLLGIVVFGLRLKEFLKGGKWYALVGPFFLIIFAFFAIWVSFYVIGVSLPGRVPPPSVPVSS